MRKVLASAKGERKKFQGIFSRFGKKVNYKGYSEPTVLLLNVIDVAAKTAVTDHIWFGLTKGFDKLKLQPGDVVCFEARVKSYKKGYVNTRYKIDNSKLDYKLSHPTNISVLK